MDLINNTTKTLKDDLSVEIKQGSKISIAASCFSIYAFQELKIPRIYLYLLEKSEKPHNRAIYSISQIADFQ